MSSGAPRSQSRIPEATTLTVTTARIASDAKRRSSRATRRRERLSCANIRASRCRRCARWTMTRPAKTNPTSAWMALRMWRSCRVPRAAAAKARRPRCTSQRDLVRHAVRDHARRSAVAPPAPRDRSKDKVKVLESPNGVFNKGNRDLFEKMAAKIREMTAAAHGAGAAVKP